MEQGCRYMWKSSSLFQRTVVLLWKKDGLEVRHKFRVMGLAGSLEQRYSQSLALRIQCKIKYLTNLQIDLYSTFS